MPPKYIPGVGPSNASLVLCGEAPGYHEDLNGYPFAGPTGKITDKCLELAGTSRAQVYLTNVIKHRPPNNDVELLHLLGKRLDDYTPQLWEELNAIRPNCVIALGNVALKALTGFTGIEKYRGSILQSLNGKFKVVPSIHPASLMHKEEEGRASSWKDLTYIQWDFNRAVVQSKTRDYSPPIRNLTIAKSALHLHRFLDYNASKHFVSVDIETFQTIPICVGLAFNSKEAISVPLFHRLSSSNELGMTRRDQIECWRLTSQLLANPNVGKIGQNFKFDQLQLSLCRDLTQPFGMPVYGFFFDTMLAFKTLYCELPASLQFQTSVLTEEPYYKEEGKGYNPKKDKLDRLLLYNAKDAVVTYECFEREMEELHERGLERHFFEEVMPLHPFYSRMETRGIKRDDFRHAFLSEKYELEEREKQEELDLIVTELTDGRMTSLNVFSNGVKGQVGQFLYNQLEIKARKGADEKTLEAIIRNEKKLNASSRDAIERVLDLRKIRKVRGTYVDVSPHPDGRLRTGCRIMLETGRTSTSVLKPPVTTRSMGLAFQTITKHGDVGTDLRSMFVPDPGYVLVEPDLSQAEARVVAVLARDEKLLKMFEFGVDVHCVTQNWIKRVMDDKLLNQFFSEPFDIECKKLAKEINKTLKSLISDEERQQGKKFRHAGHYDMGPIEASRQIGLAQGIVKKILDMFHFTNQNIKKVFHAGIIEALNTNNRKLKNPFGRERQFLNHWGPELFKEAYAQIPQSTVSDQTKRAMIRIERELGRSVIEFLSESHDSFLAQVRVSDLARCAPVIRKHLEDPIDFRTCTLSRDVRLVIPCSIKVSTTNWEEVKDYELS